MKIKGKLEYHSLFEPIDIFIKGEIKKLDLWVFYDDLFKNLNAKKTSMDIGMNFITIKQDETSDQVLDYKSENDTLLIILKKSDGGFGWTNIASYLPEMLRRLNGMSVIVEHKKNSISITNDPKEKVYGLYYTDGNSCKIPDDDVKSICKIGESDCCIFCSVTGDGFECQKFDSMARTMLQRHSEGTMRASRIGNCMILGRKEK